MPRAIASLSLSFGLVSIPVKLFSATESSSAIRFRLMRDDGSRVRQQYVSDEPPDLPRNDIDRRSLAMPEQPSNVRQFGRGKSALAVSEPEMDELDDEPSPVVVQRRDMVKGYEFEKGKFVLFTADELKALEDASRQTIDIVSFVPQDTIDPIYYDKAYLLAPDKRGNKPYSLLHEAMRTSGRCALAKWAWRSKQYVVQVRAVDGGLILQQLRYAEEVRSLRDLKIELTPATKAELQLALQLIEHISEDAFDSAQFVDEEKQRILAAVERKIAGQEIVARDHAEAPRGEVIDLMDALRASLSAPRDKTANDGSAKDKNRTQERKPARRASKSFDRPATAKAGGKK